jgi:hypothetical protein
MSDGLSRQKAAVPRFAVRFPQEVSAVKKAKKLQKDAKTNLAPCVLESWRRRVAEPLTHLEASTGLGRWFDSAVAPRTIKAEEAKRIDLPRTISLPDLSLGKGAWPKEYESTSSFHGRHLKGFAYEKLTTEDKYAHFSVKIRDPARFDYISKMDLSLQSDNEKLVRAATQRAKLQATREAL